MAIIKGTEEVQLISLSVNIRREFDEIVDGKATAKNPKLLMDVYKVGLESGKVGFYETILIDPSKLTSETAQALYAIEGVLVSAFEQHYNGYEQ